MKITFICHLPSG